VEAPAEITSGGVRYRFDFWRFNGAVRTFGQQELTVPDLQGNPSNTLEASYARVWHSFPISSSPTNGATFTLTPNDRLNRSGGTTPLAVQYEDNVTFSVVAATTHNGAPFERWIIDGVPQPPGRQLMMTARDNRVLVAAYRVPVCGSFTSFGATCNTALGARHVAASSRPTCGPHIGDTVDYSFVNTNASVGGVLIIGSSNTTWNGIPLPLVIPTQPDCFIRVEVLATIGFGIIGIPGNGGVFGLRIPMDAGLINGRLFTQCVAVGPIGFHQFSNGIETLIGGFP
jgi:hypothetical protein